MIYIGVDPGRNGAVAVMDLESVIITPFKKLTRQDTLNVFLSIDSTQKRYACIELVHSMPTDGVASAFKFGRHYGFLLASLYAACIDFNLVQPAKWQRAMGCLTGGDKNVSKRRAQKLFPDLKITHANADALLIAEYCKRVKEGTL